MEFLRFGPLVVVFVLDEGSNIPVESVSPSHESVRIPTLQYSVDLDFDLLKTKMLSRLTELFEGLNWNHGNLEVHGITDFLPDPIFQELGVTPDPVPNLLPLVLGRLCGPHTVSHVGRDVVLTYSTPQTPHGERPSSIVGRTSIHLLQI